MLQSKPTMMALLLTAVSVGTANDDLSGKYFMPDGQESIVSDAHRNFAGNKPSVRPPTSRDDRFRGDDVRRGR